MLREILLDIPSDNNGSRETLLGLISAYSLLDNSIVAIFFPVIKI